MTCAPGFVISWRCKWDHPVFRRKQEAAVWAWMCDTAQWQDYRMPTKFGPIDLKRGELIISEREVAEDFGLHRNTLRTLIQRMVDDGMITLIRDRTPHRFGTIVSIVKYEQYQQVDLGQKEGQDRKPTVNRTEAGPKEDRSGTKNKQYKEDKEEKEEKEEDTPPSPPHGGWCDPDLVKADISNPEMVPVPGGGAGSSPEPEFDLGASPDASTASLTVPEKPKAERKPKAKPLFTEAEIDDLFVQFMAAYPARDRDHSLKGARRIFGSALKRKIDPVALTSAAARYLQETKNDRSFGTKYVKDAFNWLNEGKWENYSGVHVLPSASGPRRSSEYIEAKACLNVESDEEFFRRTAEMRKYR